MTTAEPTLQLYVITPDTADTDLLLHRVGAALAGGAGIVQYRNKKASPALRLQQASALQTLCHTHGVPLIINDHLELALAVDAAGLHLGADDGHVAAARRALGPQRWLGASCYHSLELARAALASGASYVAFGALFASSSKPQAPRASLQILTQAATLGCPLCGIGGIDAGNAALAVKAGAHWLAVIAAVFGAEDVEAATRQLVSAMHQSAGGA